MRTMMMWSVGWVLLLGGLLLADGGRSPRPAPGPATKAKPAPRPQAARPAAKKPVPRKPGGAPARPTRGRMRRGGPVRRVIRIRAREIYYGRYRHFRRPAVLDLQKVFDAIPYYRELKAEGLTKKDARYWMLMEKSNRVFFRALYLLARRQGFDLIGGLEAIRVNGRRPPDVTGEVVRLVPAVTLF